MSAAFQTSRLRLVGLLGLVTLHGVHAAEPVAASRPVQQRIDALLKRRLRPEPLPVNPPNPFQLRGGAIRNPGSDELAAPSVPESEPAAKPAVTSATAANLQLLTSIVSRLKFGGLITLRDQIQVVVNGEPRKEGDSIVVEWNNNLFSVKIVRLLPGQLLLRYADAEIPLRF